MKAAASVTLLALLLSVVSSASAANSDESRRASNANGGATSVHNANGEQQQPPQRRRASDNSEELEDVVQEFAPPKLSFTSEDYFRDLVAADSSDNREPSWTVFQGSSSTDEQPASSSSLLTLVHNQPRAKHVVLTPDEQRAYLVEHAEVCLPGNNSEEATTSSSLLAQYDLLSASSSTSHLAHELWKYCSLYNEGGVYVDGESVMLVGLGDVLGWTPKNNNNANYAVLASSHSSGISPSLLKGASISTPVTYASSYAYDNLAVEGAAGVPGAGDDAATTAVNGGTTLGTNIITTPLLAISQKHNPIPLSMVEKIVNSSVRELQEDALLLPRALMGLIAADEEKAGKVASGESSSGKWNFFRQRCQGVEVAGGDSVDSR